MEIIPLGFLEFGFKDLIETLIIALILTYVYRLVRGSLTIHVFTGLLFIIAINAVVSFFNLTTLHFILRSVLDVGVLAVFILFQPEIRRLLYNIGQNTNLGRFFNRSEELTILDEIIEGVKRMARTRTGALIVFSSQSNLQDMVAAGTRIDAEVSADLLMTIFNKNTPLHDGAVIIKNNRILAASCYLPISPNPRISATFGTRHRAAVGVTEANSVFVVVVSEETGRISVARNGQLISGLTIQKLRKELEAALGKVSEAEKDVSFTKKKPKG